MSISLPRPLSHSSMTMYQECPQKYKFKYIDKIPEKPRHFFSFGSSVHSALEFFYGVKTLPAPTLAAVLKHYEDNWISAGYRDAGQEAEYMAEGKDILRQFYAKHIGDFAIPFFVEYSFSMEVDGVPVTGKIDRIDKLADGRLSVLDYKTGKALVADRVSQDAQLTMYQLACETLLGARVARLSFYHLPTLKEQIVERHPADLVAGLKTRIVKTAEAIAREDFAPKPVEKVCFWCDYKPICPVYRAAPAPAPAQPLQDEDLSGLIDRFGDLSQKLAEAQLEAEQVKTEIIALLKRKGFVRSFGTRYEVIRSMREKWEFSDKKKILELLREYGYFESVLAPSAPKIEQLLSNPALDADLRARLTELGVKVETPDLKLKPL